MSTGCDAFNLEAIGDSDEIAIRTTNNDPIVYTWDVSAPSVDSNSDGFKALKAYLASMNVKTVKISKNHMKTK